MTSINALASCLNSTVLMAAFYPAALGDSSGKGAVQAAVEGRGRFGFDAGHWGRPPCLPQYSFQEAPEAGAGSEAAQDSSSEARQTEAESVQEAIQSQEIEWRSVCGCWEAHPERSRR
jgi:hypothetical protein